MLASSHGITLVIIGVILQLSESVLYAAQFEVGSWVNGQLWCIVGRRKRSFQCIGHEYFTDYYNFIFIWDTNSITFTSNTRTSVLYISRKLEFLSLRISSMYSLI